MEDYRKIAIELGQTLINKAPETRGDVERMLPELKEESEDERIMMEIVEHINNMKALIVNSLREQQFNSWLAWLEKQGEQKSYGQSSECVDCQFNYAGECKGSCGMKRSEQTPADKKGMNIVEEDMTPFQKKVFCIIDTAIEEEQGLKQVCDELLRLAHDEIMQKPDWSEEDEEYCQCLIKDIEKSNPLPTSIYSDCKKWLKSFKDRVQPQSQWKPSDEQMEAMENAIKPYCKGYGWNETPLGTLYNNLKKLKS